MAMKFCAFTHHFHKTFPLDPIPSCLMQSAFFTANIIHKYFSLTFIPEYQLFKCILTLLTVSITVSCPLGNILRKMFNEYTV